MNAKKLLLLICLSVSMIFVSISIVHATSYGKKILVEYSTDRAGADLRSGFNSSFRECMDDCARTSTCKSFTWVKSYEQPPNYDNSRPLCWLKSSVPVKRQNSGMISGVKQ